MRRLQIVLLLLASVGLLDGQDPTPAGAPSGGVLHAWRQPPVASPDMANSGCLENLVRAGS